MQKQRFALLDILKFCSVIIIALFHIRDYVWVPFATGYGWMLNAFFFCVSGFGMQYSSYSDKISQDDYTIFRFLKERIGKIYITFVITILFCILTQGLRNIPDMLRDLFMLTPLLPSDGTGIYNAWFICALTEMYILFYVINRYQKKNAMWIYFVMVVLGHSLWMYNVNLPFFTKKSSFGMMTFFTGCLYKRLFDFTANFTDKARKLLSFLCGIIIICICCGCVVYQDPRPILGHDLDEAMIFVISPLVLGWVIHWESANRLLNGKIVKYLSKISFYLFLWNNALNVVYHRIATPLRDHQYLYAVVYLIVLFLWSEMTRRIVEVIYNKFLPMLGNWALINKKSS